MHGPFITIIIITGSAIIEHLAMFTLILSSWERCYNQIEESHSLTHSPHSNWNI